MQIGRRYREKIDIEMQKDGMLPKSKKFPFLFNVIFFQNGSLLLKIKIKKF